MAQKTFPQFPAGTPSATRIFLHADPSTGEIEKAEMSEIAGGGSVLALSEYIGATNSGTNPQDISTITIPANTLQNDGDFIRWEAYMRGIGAVNTKTIQWDFGGNALTGPNATNAGFFRLSGQLFRIDATHAEMHLFTFRDNSAAGSGFTESFVTDFTTALTSIVRITAGSAGDIRMNYQALTVFSV